MPGSGFGFSGLLASAGLLFPTSGGLLFRGDTGDFPFPALADGGGPGGTPPFGPFPEPLVGDSGGDAELGETSPDVDMRTDFRASSASALAARLRR